MQPGAYMDLAQVTLYVFWIFFACLIFYLRREDKREGYPLDSTASGGGVVHGFPRMPDPKNYLLRTGHIATLPNHKNDRRDVAVAPIAVWPGAPMEPISGLSFSLLKPSSSTPSGPAERKRFSHVGLLLRISAITRLRVAGSLRCLIHSSSPPDCTQGGMAASSPEPA